MCFIKHTSAPCRAWASHISAPGPNGGLSCFTPAPGGRCACTSHTSPKAPRRPLSNFGAHAKPASLTSQRWRPTSASHVFAAGLCAGDTLVPLMTSPRRRTGVSAPATRRRLLRVCAGDTPSPLTSLPGVLAPVTHQRLSCLRTGAAKPSPRQQHAGPSHVSVPAPRWCTSCTGVRASEPHRYQSNVGAVATEGHRRKITFHIFLPELNNFSTVVSMYYCTL